MEKLKKILITILITICILVSPENKAVATDLDLDPYTAGLAIAGYARKFYDEHADDVTYCSSNYGCDVIEHRRMAYQDQLVNGKWHLECMGFATYIVYKSLHIEYPCIMNGSHGIVYHFGYGGDGTYNDDYCGGHGFELIARGLTYENICDKANPGDLFVNGHHVMVYVGNHEIIHSDSTIRLSKETVEEYGERYGEGDSEWGILRISQEAAATVTDPDSGGSIPNIGDGVNIILDKITGWVGDFLEEQENIPIGTPRPEIEANLYYKGLSTEKEKISNENQEDGWKFPSISSVIDWVVGAIFMPIRAAVTGFAQIVQVLVSQYVANVSGEPTTLNANVGLLENIQQQMKDSLTLEKILYNQVPVLDVNVFNLTNARRKNNTSKQLNSSNQRISSKLVLHI